MKQQGVHPEDPESTSDASSRPGAGGADRQDTGDTEGKDAVKETPRRPASDGEPDEVYADEVEGDEPLLPARVHRPSDLMRLLIGVLAVAVLLAVAAFAHGTTSGLE